jgi:hypothetical protein
MGKGVTEKNNSHKNNNKVYNCDTIIYKNKHALTLFITNY